MRLTAIAFLLSMASVYAQQSPVTAYLDETGEYAAIYSGQIESQYNVRLYESLPYYKGTDFKPGELTCDTIHYPGLKMRLDLYKDQLIIQSPENRMGIILNPDKVNRAVIEGDVFIWQKPAGKKGLKEGYYLALYDSSRLKLLRKDVLSLDARSLSINRFETEIRYYAVFEDKNYQLKNKNSFIRIFPEYKKEINQFVKDNSLNFMTGKEQSYISLIKYCEELLRTK